MLNLLSALLSYYVRLLSLSLTQNDVYFRKEDKRIALCSYRKYFVIKLYMKPTFRVNCCDFKVRSGHMPLNKFECLMAKSPSLNFVVC